MYTLDSPSQGVSPVKFKKGKDAELISYLTQEHSQALQDRAGLEQKWKHWSDQANSRRKADGASARGAKIDMPLTARRLIQHKSRLINPIFQQDQLMVAKSRKNMHHDWALQLEDCMDYYTDKVDMQGLAEDWVDQFDVFNFGCVKTPFTQTIKHIKQWEPIDEEVYAQLEAEELNDKKLLKRDMDNGQALHYVEVEKRVVTQVGANPEVIPIEDIICPITTASVETADWWTHRAYLTRATVKARVREGIYDKTDQNGAKIMDALGNPSAARKKLLDYGVTQKDGGGEEEPSSKQYEILETYLSFDYDGSDIPKEIIVTWDRKSGSILRAVDNFYQNYCRPFVTFSYKNVHGSVFGIPATFLLEPLHVANSASFRQRLDTASLANETPLIVPRGQANELKAMVSTRGWESKIYEADVTKDEMFQPQIGGQFTQLPELEAKFEQQADDLMSLSDYSFGREQIQRPTATGQTSIIEESKQPLYGQLERFRKAFALVVLHMLSRYRQFYPEGLEYYIESQDQESMQQMQQLFLEWPSDAIEDAVIIETKVTSAQMSKHLRKQEIVALLDRVPQVYESMMGMAQVATTPGPMSMIAAKALGGMQNTFEQFLVEFEVPQKDQLNQDWVQEAQVGQMVAQQMQQMQQQIQTMGAQLQNAQGQLAAIQGGGGVPGPGMGPQPGPPPGVQGPPPMGGPPA